MKALILYCILFLAVQQCIGQVSAKPAYLRYPVIPQFTLLSVDSQAMTKDVLPKKTKTMLMYFSPSCDHCQVQTNEMIKNMDRLRDVQILMITNQPYFEMKTYYKEKNLARYKNIKMGQDDKFFFPPYYKMKNLPFVALYDKQGYFITTFEGNTSIAKIAEAFTRNGIRNEKQN